MAESEKIQVLQTIAFHAMKLGHRHAEEIEAEKNIDMFFQMFESSLESEEYEDFIERGFGFF
jgi:protein-arginine kinase activator protein McsA